LTQITKNKNNFILGIAALVLLGFFIYQYTNSNRLDWSLFLDSESQQPYGFFAAKEILKTYPTSEKLIVLDEKLAKSLPSEAAKNANYVFIGEALLLDSSDVEQLLDFVEEGNTAFISSVTLPDLLMEEVFYSSVCDSFYWEDYFVYRDTALITNFVHEDLKAEKDFVFPYVNNYQVRAHYWSAFVNHLFCHAESYPTIISQTPDSVVNMAMIPLGEGAFYLQSTPIALTNYYLTKESGQLYAEKVFSHLEDGRIYWDDFSNVPANVGRNKNWASRDPLEMKEGPLDYLLSQAPLAWAWYLLLTLGLLYILFRAKRRQRVIPILPENKNTSLAFITTIGRLHFSKQNHRRLAIQKIDLLLAFIRNKYKLDTKDLGADFIQNLTRASELEKGLIQKIFLINQNIKSSNFVSDKTLIELHKLIHFFYKNCR
jgi:hypothetical protein